MKKYSFYYIGFLWFICLLIISCDNNPDRDDIPGKDSAFDPIASLPKIKKFAGGEECILVYLNVRFIKPDGTMDFDALYKPTAEYRFIRELKSSKKKKKETPEMPLGVTPAAVKEDPHWEVITVNLTQQYTETVRDQDEGEWDTYIYGGMVRNIYSYVDTPLNSVEFNILKSASDPLSFATLWQKADRMGIPGENAVAVINYDPKSGYTFTIENTDYKCKFDLEGNYIE
ncbi:MAG: hypothetical protein JXB49_24925 [Bacteroidales bacterium]|nr:hypothetical protein [Bacteroidales bacterium]